MKNKGPWAKVSKAGFLTEQRAEQPGPGVWIRSDRVEADFQHTVERVAKDGVELPPRDAWCGQDRHNAWVRATKLLKS